MSAYSDMDGIESKESSYGGPAEIELVVVYKSAKHAFTMAAMENVHDLKTRLATELNVPVKNQKLLAKSLLDDNVLLKDVKSSKVMLLGSTKDEVDSMQAMKGRSDRIPKYPARLPKRKPASSQSQYCFSQIMSLSGFRDANQAQQLLERLAHDHGIVYVMNKYQLKVDLLTELDPASATSHDSKILGLNMNNGQKILLRLRGDDYDGFRDYKMIRRTLCHELAHNRHGDHDDLFWEFYRILDKETVQYSSGFKLGDEYVPPETHEAVDNGAFIGGTFTLGGEQCNLSAREAILRAAQERNKR